MPGGMEAAKKPTLMEPDSSRPELPAATSKEAEGPKDLETRGPGDPPRQTCPDAGPSFPSFPSVTSVGTLPRAASPETPSPLAPRPSMSPRSTRGGAGSRDQRSEDRHQE